MRVRVTRKGGEEGMEKAWETLAPHRTRKDKTYCPSRYQAFTRPKSVSWLSFGSSFRWLITNCSFASTMDRRREGRGGGMYLDVFPVLHPHDVRLVDHGYLDAAQKVVVPTHFASACE